MTLLYVVLVYLLALGRRQETHPQDADSRLHGTGPSE